MNIDTAKLSLNEPLGIIAGRGDFPLILCRCARQAGVRYLGVIALQQDTSKEIEELADHVDWVYPGQLNRAMRYLKCQNISQIIFSGQIKPGRLFTGLRPDWRAARLLWRLKERNAETIFSATAGEFEKAGIRVLPSTLLMQDSLAEVGVLGHITPGKVQQQDIEFGRTIAREISRLNIGQTVVVKKGTVLAVEGFEGTDKAIIRGGDLGHGDVTVVKVAKPFHDLRFDVPCVGMKTVESLCKAEAKAIAVQAGMTLLLEREKVIAACDKAGIAVVGIECFDDKNNKESDCTSENS